MATLAFGFLASQAGLSGAAAAVLTGAATAAGAYIDSTLVYPAIFKQDGPRKLDDLQLQTASEGSPINYVLGTARVAGTMIWCGPLESEKDGGGKGGAKASSQYTYFNSFAIGICEGPVIRIKKIWADSRLVYSDVGFRNLLIYSDAFDETGWVGEHLTVTPDVDVDPQGGNRADLVTTTATDASLGQEHVDVKSSGHYTLSFWAKSGTLTGPKMVVTAKVPVSDGLGGWTVQNQVVVNQSYTPTGSWTRFSTSFILPSFPGSIPGGPGGAPIIVKPQINVYILNGSSGTGTIEFYGAQLEEGDSMGGYDPTEATTNITDPISFQSNAFYKGTYDQPQDPLIASYQGIGNTPAFRGLAYIVFEKFNISLYGNRIPQFTFLIEQDPVLTTRSLCTYLLDRANVDSSDYDVTDIIEYPVKGLSVAGPQPPIKLLEHALVVGDLLVAESQGVIKFVQRSESVALPIAESYLVAHEQGEEDPPRKLKLTDQGTYDLPSEVILNYIDPVIDYQRGSHRERTSIWKTDGVKTIDLPVVLESLYARNITFRSLWAAWMERRSVEIQLPPSHLQIEETDLLAVTVGTETYNIRVRSVTRGANFVQVVKGPIERQETFQETATYVPGDIVGFVPSRVMMAKELRLVVLDIPALKDTHATQAGFYYAVAARGGADYQGAGLYTSDDADANVSQVSTVSAQAVMGTASTTLGDGPTNTWDNINTLTVVLDNGELESRSEDEVLAGENWMLVGSEIIGFQTATLIADKTYTLSGLLRGMRGTEAHTGTHAADEDVVQLDQNIRFQQMDLGTLGTPINFRAIPLGGFVENYDPQITAALTGATLKPLAPVDIVGARDGSNNLTVTWTPRTRALTKVFGPDDASLPDELDSYEVDVLDGSGNVLRTIVVPSGSSCSYSAANQTADGLTPGSPVNVAVYQLSVTIGRGFPGKATV